MLLVFSTSWLGLPNSASQICLYVASLSLRMQLAQPALGQPEQPPAAANLFTTVFAGCLTEGQSPWSQYLFSPRWLKEYQAPPEWAFASLPTYGLALSQ